MLAEEQERKNTLLKTKENTYIKVNQSFQMFCALNALENCFKIFFFLIGRKTQMGKGEVNFGAFLSVKTGGSENAIFVI